MSNNKNLKDNPLKVYDNVLFVSSEKGTKLPIKADFVIMGDTAELITSIVIQMKRHPHFAEMIETAVTVYKKS